MKNRLQHGLSMVELLVSMLIGMMVVMGVGTIWTSSRQTYRFEEDLARIQENGRYVMETLAYDIRMAGFFGCADDIGSISSHLGTIAGGSLKDTSRVIEGRERGGSSWQNTGTLWLPSDSTEVDDADIIPGTDAITLRYLSGSRFRLTETMSSLSDTITVDRAPAFAAGQLAAVTDCAGGDLVAVSAATGTGTDVSHGQTLSKVYEGHASREISFVHAFNAVRYYVGTGSNGYPTLIRRTLDGGGNEITQELLEGVENLQFLYGIDNADDELPDTYVTAANVSDWNLVRTVRIAALVASLDEYGAEHDSADYAMLDETIPGPDDRRRRRVFSATVQVRNNR